jgi:phosphate ABC transporter phosphate-binding protein
MTITYDAIGSEAGIARLAEGKVDFAASDMPLKPENVLGALHVIHFPTVLGGVVPIFNLPSTDRGLRLTPEILSGVYSGASRKWNDPRIVEINHGARLPDADIAVIYRSDGSGTTFVWTSYLSISSPAWKSSVGAGPRVRWPIGTGAAGNEGVAELVAKTPNSIGYVELIYAIQHELSYAAMRNSAGEFIKADLGSITAAAAGASVSPGEEFRSSILDSRNKGAYPLSTFTWLLVPEDGISAEKRSAIADWLQWTLTFGQKQCASLGYAPLPTEIVNSELKSLSKWKTGGQ